ncbi:iron-containing redox enzyme family protein [Actinomadura rudentiformis]|uniref:Iron-containing redox enzyme family protein n=1 Tax=Actinomadura rudentiformis TaxID=359158 RepID=A0A6H9Z8Z7_9ACTN|nr:iron-containing redox enzyme family protein [Actinomadura rudentiformis]KAB2352786.1 iron-containing redox enzyme family protein [Actinomadura rudentiformis]
MVKAPPQQAGGAAPRTEAPPLPEPRGPLSETLLAALREGPRSPRAESALPATAAGSDPLGEDLQLALYACYELHYRGFAGVAPEWEWEPSLLRLRASMEREFLMSLRERVPGGDDVSGVIEELLVEPVDADGVSHHLRDAGERWQLREYIAHRSIYHLKEADPHAWLIPRLDGRAKAALVAVEFDEFGGGRAERMHSRLFADLMEELHLDPAYGAYLDVVPAVMLATVNMMSMFGLHRASRGAMVGHFAAAEITTAPSAQRLARALERLDVGPRGLRFFTEHIEADAVHEQVLRREVIGGLLESEPELASDIVLGVQATGLLEDRLGDHLLGCWRSAPARSSLRRPLRDAGRPHLDHGGR